MTTRMKRAWTTTAALALLTAGPVLAQRTAEDAARSREQEDKDRARIQQKVQDHHKMLDLLAGSWDGTFTTMAQGTPPTPVTSPGTMENRWDLDHSFLVSEIDFKMRGENRFKTRSYLGYNPGSDQYTRFTMVYGDAREHMAAGTYDPATRTFVFQGVLLNPMTHDPLQRRDTFRVAADGQITYRIDFIFADKTEIKVAEGSFQRKK